MDHKKSRMNRSKSLIEIACVLIFLLGSATVYAKTDPPEKKPAAAVNDSSSAIEITGDTPWVIGPHEPDALKRAIEDVKLDWYKVFGRLPVVMTQPPKLGNGPVIYFGLREPWMQEFVRKPFKGPESFFLQLQKDAAGNEALVATGADLRGAIYAAYDLSEEILAVDPWYFWTDHQPKTRTSITVPRGFSKYFGPPTFKYRGWFINDEDLLTGFAPDPLRENTYSLEMADRICETILRLRGNMIAPATFAFPDERIYDLAAKRGLVLTFNHVQVMGLNTYRWPKGVPFSFSKHPEIMERYWRICINALKDKEVVWTVGYRGKEDRPFYYYEPEFSAPQAQGAEISRAIAKQVQMLREVQPDASVITNLWDEGARLYQNRYLRVPKGVTIVWSDDGTGIILDSGRAQAGQGLYYHTAVMSSKNNQLTEEVSPGTIYNQMGRFARVGATDYFLVNTSDIRPVPLSTDCAMRLAWDAKPCLKLSDQENTDNFFTDWCRREYDSSSAKGAAELYAAYFNIPCLRQDVRKGENAVQTSVRNLDNIAAPLILHGKSLGDNLLNKVRDLLKQPPPAVSKNADWNTIAYPAANLPYLTELEKEVVSFLPHIPESRREFYKGHLLTQVRIYRYSFQMLQAYCRALLAYADNDKSASVMQAKNALLAQDDLFTTLHEAEYGKWAGWYQSEGLEWLDNIRDRLRSLVAVLQGQVSPPQHLTYPGYEYFYRYQEPFLGNFPLLYPATKVKTAGKAGNK